MRRNEAIGGSKGGLSNKIHASAWMRWAIRWGFTSPPDKLVTPEGADQLQPLLVGDTLLANKGYDADRGVIDHEFLDGTRHVIYPWNQSKIENRKSSSPRIHPWGQSKI